MGSNGALRNSQNTPEVILERTIWALATFLAACCKNHLCQKAPATYVYPIHQGFYQDPDTYPNEKVS